MIEYEAQYKDMKELVKHNFDKVSQNLTFKLADPAEEVDPGNLAWLFLTFCCSLE